MVDMNGMTNFWHKTYLLANLSVLLLKGIILWLSNKTRGAFVSLLKRRSPVSRLSLMVSTYEIMRERLVDSLNEIEQKNRSLEESREKLKGSRDFLQAIIDSLDEDLMVLDNELHIVQANQSLRRKHPDIEIVGRYCYEVSHGLTHPCGSTSSRCPLGEVKKTGRSTRMVQTHSDGQDGNPGTSYLEVSISPLYDSQGNATQFVELMRDITDSKELENRILEANRHLLVLNAISSTASQSLSLDVILNGALDKALELFEAEMGSIVLFDEKPEIPSYRVHRNIPEDSPQGAINLEMVHRVIASGETLIESNTSSTLSLPEGIKIYVSVPLKTKDKVVGVLSIVSRIFRQFSEREIQLLTSIGQQLGIIVENAQLYRECRLKEDSRTELLRRIIMAQEDERHRVARELHDVTSQTLATLAVGLEGLTPTQRSNEKELANKLEKMRVLLADTSKDIHRLIYDLRPSQLDDLGLPVALRSCAHNSLDAAGVEVYMEVAGQERRLAPEIEIALFRIAQEAIANISRHAHAESAYINLEYRDKSIAIQVEDDGVGFDFTQGFSGRSGSGVGLLGMKERAELLGGNLSINTNPGKGTRIAVEIPTK